MDPISHLVFGRALAAVTPQPPARRGLTAAIVIGSITPDVDALLMPSGWDRYLVWHQRGTHALLGTTIDALALAGLLWGAMRVIDRIRARQHAGEREPAAHPSSDTTHGTAPGTTVGSPGTTVGPGATAGSSARDRTRFRHLWLAGWIGCLGHITLDLVSGGTIRLFAPFSAVPFGMPFTAMADPLLAVPLVLFGLATLIATRHVRALAIGVLCVLAGVLVVKGISERVAHGVYRHAMARQAARLEETAQMGRADGEASGTSRVDGVPAAATLRAVEARWGSFTAWMFYDRTGSRLRAWTVDARTGAVTLDVERTVMPPDLTPETAALIASSRDLQTVRHLFSLFDLTFVRTRRHGTDVDVLWTDIRFCGPTGCPLWFGGTFDATGRAREQVVIIGIVRQTRPI